MRLVHEDFFAPVVGDDESEPFGRVEPFNCAFLVVGEERGIRRRFAIGLGTRKKSNLMQKKYLSKIRTRKKSAPARHSSARTNAGFFRHRSRTVGIAEGLVCYCVVERDGR